MVISHTHPVWEYIFFSFQYVIWEVLWRDCRQLGICYQYKLLIWIYWIYDHAYAGHEMNHSSHNLHTRKLENLWHKRTNLESNLLPQNNCNRQPLRECAWDTRPHYAATHTVTPSCCGLVYQIQPYVGYNTTAWKRKNSVSSWTELPVTTRTSHI